MTPSAAAAAPSQAQPVVLVLAAGKGQRFLDAGGATHKLRAPLHGRTVLEWTLAAVAASGLAHRVIEPDPHLQTMGDSIAHGVACTPEASAWLLLPADLPAIQAATLQQVARIVGAGMADAARPSFQGSYGHPVGFAASQRENLLKLRGKPGGVAVFRSSDAMVFEVNDWGCTCDVDTPSALAVLAARWQPPAH